MCLTCVLAVTVTFDSYTAVSRTSILDSAGHLSAILSLTAGVCHSYRWAVIYVA
jgi:hypothetical protein